MSNSLSGGKRSGYCGEISVKHKDTAVTVKGWVQRRRDHGGLIFIDLRDRSGIVQVVFSPEVIGETLFRESESVRSEYVLSVTGMVRGRPEGTVNANLTTGEIEIYAEGLEILNRAKTPPFYIEDEVNVDEMVRLKYRYLDLRRPEMQKMLMLRHRVAFAMREFLDKEGFLEIETPVLTKSSPEGARDYLVPSRVQPGNFFALPQSPQLFKQLLMVSGMDKYFQIARCFRDEDLRADRQPEFTQLDMEMSFVNAEDVISVSEQLMQYVFKKALDKDIATPFPRLTYADAMSRFGSDKPDLRFGIELTDIADIAKESEFKVFASVANAGGWVRGINAKGCAKYSRKELDDLTNFAAIYGAKGLAWISVTAEGLKSPIIKFFTEEQVSAICGRLNAEEGDLLLFVAADMQTTAASLGALRCEIAARENLIDKDEFNFLWVVDFPMLEYVEEDKRWKAMHHPFTSPLDSDLDNMEANPETTNAKAYDMVLNGMELGGGSIRIHRRDIQERVFNMLGIEKDEQLAKFGYLLEAFEYGTPPHGGVAFGLDRLIRLMANRENIRDVIAFPKTQSAADMMVQAPSAVADKQLKELHIKSTLAQQ